MLNERVLAKTASISSAREAWNTGWNHEKRPEWVEVRLLAFTGVGNNRTHAVIVRDDGVVKDIPLDDIRFDVK